MVSEAVPLTATAVSVAGVDGVVGVAVDDEAPHALSAASTVTATDAAKSLRIMFEPRTEQVYRRDFNEAGLYLGSRVARGGRLNKAEDSSI